MNILQQQPLDPPWAKPVLNSPLPMKPNLITFILYLKYQIIIIFNLILTYFNITFSTLSSDQLSLLIQDDPPYSIRSISATNTPG